MRRILLTALGLFFLMQCQQSWAQISLSPSSAVMLASPEVTQETLPNGEVHLKWAAIQGAKNYEVNINDQGWKVANATLGHIEHGLKKHQKVNIKVRAKKNKTIFSPPTTMDFMLTPCGGTVTIGFIRDVSCNGVADGLVLLGFNVFGVNNAGTISYSLDGGTPQIFGQFTNVPGGLHLGIAAGSLTGCQDTVKFTIKEPAPTNFIFQIDSVLCKGGNTGKVTALAAGGNNTPFTYQWNTTPTINGPIASGLKKGTYTVTASFVNTVTTTTNPTVQTQNYTCTATETATVFEPTDLMIGALADSVHCFNTATGAIALSVGGGTPNYTYQWSGPAGYTSTAKNPTNLNSGKYTVTTTDTHGCQKIGGIQVFQPTELQLDTIATPVSCANSKDGTATAIVTGGSPNYTYTWAGNPNTTATITNISSGNYPVTVTDKKGCTKKAVAIVAQKNPIQLLVTTQPTRCIGQSDGEANVVIISGGNAPFQYQWSDSKKQTAATANSLAIGKYTVTVTDASGCSVSETLEIVDPLPITFKKSKTNAKCTTANDGAVYLTDIIGGAGNYLVSWAGPNNFVQFGNSITDIGIGTYAFTITDDNGCIAKDTAAIFAPQGVQIDSIRAKPTKCNGMSDGSAMVFASKGLLPYSYKWDDNNGQIANPAINVKAGLIAVTVTDANGCKVKSDVTIAAPAKISIQSITMDISCKNGKDGKAKAMPTGGTPPYSYIWNDLSGQTTQEASNLTFGNYNVTVTDSNGCKESDDVIVYEPSFPMTMTLAQTLKGCAGAKGSTAAANVFGGTPTAQGTYSYTWSNNNSIDKTATGLKPIVYSVTATDTKGCKLIDSLQITELDSIRGTIAFVKPTCFGASDGKGGINIVSGGTGNSNPDNYNYKWSNGSTSSLNSGLTGGKNYKVTISDGQGCTGIAQGVLSQPNPVSLVLTASPTTCYENEDGKIMALATGDNTTYTYSWSANASGQTTQTITDLGVGAYTVTATDDKGCTATASANIAQPQALSILGFDRKSVKCQGENTGSALVKVQGGTPEYSYKWQNGSNTASVNTLSAGTQNVTVTDANGCLITGSTTIVEPSLLVVTGKVQDISCNGKSDGVVKIKAEGGTQPYKYSVDGGDFNGLSTLVAMKAGNYTIQVRDAYGCITSEEITLNEPKPFIFDAGRDTMMEYGDTIRLNTAFENNTGTIKINWEPPFDMYISCNNCAAPKISPENTVTLRVRAVDSLGCRTEDAIYVQVKKKRGLEVPTGFTPNGDGYNDILSAYGKNNITSLTFRVFDRWGELLYSIENAPIVNDGKTGWDGTFRGNEMPSDVYVWYAEALYTDGVKLVYKGHTTLIR